MVVIHNSVPLHKLIWKESLFRPFVQLKVQNYHAACFPSLSPASERYQLIAYDGAGKVDTTKFHWLESCPGGARYDIDVVRVNTTSRLTCSAVTCK